jgi:hypothetical protein
MTHWFLVEMHFDVVAGDEPIQHHTQWRLLQANGSAWAKQRAAQIGTHEGQAALAELQNLVKWQFAGVGTVMLLDTTLDGAEVLSHFTWCLPAAVV